ncbi:hypothetical protein MTBPR1_30104 [Candidatus Terasakiella magnetica]|uniref:Uncharacterized protein n=1 Tax=Candidatus Terasakiella magnetica TaxID=1867952 RepID=A0A1C3RHQ3_9PROT|nr:hypothetical protein [Candidatus Terasakiella magnetica]SCA56734.1 hypothetical protein MTBPR1_30104 [Candidatus Terasakiella magnetica]
MFDKWKPHIQKARNAKVKFERGINRCLAIADNIRHSVWLGRTLKWTRWSFRLCIKISKIIICPLYAPFALLRYLLSITGAFIRGQKSRSAYVLCRKRQQKKDEQKEKRWQNKPSWRRWFGLLFLFFLLKGTFWKVIALTISPWTLCVFFLRRLWSAKSYVDECRQDKRDAVAHRKYQTEEAERETTRLLRKQEEENRFERARDARRTEALQALKDF